MKQTTVFYIILTSCLISLTRAAPKPQSDNDELNFDVLQNQNVDYNDMVAHVKDFFMYLPAMFSTFRETMSGFPKLAEGIRILASPNYEKSTDDDDNHCKCKTKATQNGNAIDKPAANGYR